MPFCFAGNVAPRRKNISSAPIVVSDDPAVHTGNEFDKPVACKVCGQSCTSVSRLVYITVLPTPVSNGYIELYRTMNHTDDWPIYIALHGCGSQSRFGLVW